MPDIFPSSFHKSVGSGEKQSEKRKKTRKSEKVVAVVKGDLDTVIKAICSSHKPKTYMMIGLLVILNWA